MVTCEVQPRTNQISCRCLWVFLHLPGGVSQRSLCASSFPCNFTIEKIYAKSCKTKKTPLDPRYDPPDVRARKDKCFQAFKAEKPFFKKWNLHQNSSLYKPVKIKDPWPHFGVAFSLQGSQRAPGPLVWSRAICGTPRGSQEGALGVDLNPWGC